MLSNIKFTNDAKLSGKIRYSLCGKFKQLERLIETANQQWWDQHFLSQYIDTKVSPRGLRIMKECPSFLDKDLSKEWANIAEFCTAKWMGLLISHRNNRLEKFKNQIAIITKEISDYQTAIPSSWLEVLRNNTKMNEDQLISMKTGKFKRDIDDYNSDRIFSWNKNNNHQTTMAPIWKKPSPLMASSNPNYQPPPPLMSLQLQNYSAPNKHPHEISNPHRTSPPLWNKSHTLQHRPNQRKINPVKNRERENGLILPLSQFYNRPIHQGKNPTTSSLLKDNIPNNGSTNISTLDHTHLINNHLTLTSDDQKPSTSMEITNHDTSNLASTNVITSPTHPSEPISFLVLSPPLITTSRKRKLTDEAAEEDEENNYLNYQKHQKLSKSLISHPTTSPQLTPLS